VQTWIDNMADAVRTETGRGVVAGGSRTARCQNQAPRGDLTLSSKKRDAGRSATDPEHGTPRGQRTPVGSGAPAFAYRQANVEWILFHPADGGEITTPSAGETVCSTSPPQHPHSGLTCEKIPTCLATSP
jgi:hypothetical protein